MAMSFNLTRNEVLNLMQVLPAEHWFQTQLLDSLTEVKPVIKTAPVVAPVPKVATFEREEVHKSERTEANSVGKCVWECYGWVCNLATANGQLCDKHADKKCFCGAQATHGCNMELQFVCGGPLCAEHRSCARHYK